MTDYGTTEIARKVPSKDQPGPKDKVKADVDRLRQAQTRPKPEDVLGLIDTYAADNPDMLPQVYQQFKRTRSVGTAVDGAIAQALYEDRVDVIEGLLTPGVYALNRIDKALWGSSIWLKVLDETRQDAMWKTLTDIHARKEQEFRAAAEQRHIDNDTQNKILRNTADPESALFVSEAFWQQEYGAMDEEEKDILITLSQSYPLDSVVDSRDILKRQGVQIPDSSFLRSILLRMLPLSPIDAESYGTSLSELFRREDIDDRAKWDLLDFHDPIPAATEAKRLFPGGNLQQSSSLLSLATREKEGTHNPENMAQRPIMLDEKQVHFIEQTRQLLADLSINDPALVAEVCGSVVGHEDAIQRRERILAAKELLLHGNAPKEFIPTLLMTGNPEEMYRKLEPYWQRIASLDGTFKEVFDGMLFYTPDLRWIKGFFEAETTLKDRGNILSSDLGTLVSRFTREDDKISQKIEDFSDDIGVFNELRSLSLFIESERRTEFQLGENRTKNSLDNLPKFAELFKKIGIPLNVAKKMYASWQTYNPDKTMSLLRNKNEVILQKFDAVRPYVREFGIEELLEVHNTFGIMNFTKATNADGDLELGMIHNQLKRWKDKSEAVNIVSFNAVKDWNLAFERDMSEVIEQVGEVGTFFFEVGSKEDIKKFIRKIGKRNRASGRKPQVQVVRISAHGLPTGVELSDDDFFGINDFPRKPTGELKTDSPYGRPNTYPNDLGDDYMVVYAACLTDADLEDGQQNFASTTNEWYGKATAGAKEPTINTTLLPEGRAERVVHWVVRPGQPGPRKGESSTYPARKMPKPVVVGS